MATRHLVNSANGPRGFVYLRLVAAASILFVLPARAWGEDARLRWSPSPDARVQGYNVYLREATKPYGPPRDAGAGQRASDGTISWTLTGLSPTTNYYVALTAYTTDRLESALSNELPIGSPNPCLQDSCTSPTQCTVQPLPDGSACGPPGAAGCGATCLASVCTGLAQHDFAIDRLKLMRSDEQLRVVASARFTTSALFAPLVSGVTLRVADGAGGLLVQATLAPADLETSRGGSVIRVRRRRDDQGSTQVRRLTMRTRGDETRVKMQIASAPPPATLPAGASLVLEAGDLCLSGHPLDCRARGRSLSCR